MKSPSLGTVLPCLLPQPRGLRPTAANGEPMLLLTPMCQALQSANQGLIFALQRGLEAFWLQKCRDHVCGPAAGLSIPLMAVSSHRPRALVSRVWEAADGHRGLKQTPGPSLHHVWAHLWSHTQGGHVAQPVLCAERAQLTHSRERSAGASPCIYSGILSTAGAV